jgi:hypothetical protein
MATSPNNVPYQEPTSALTFGDLILEVAREMGVAYYGAAGDEEIQIPINAPDLAECERHVNNGLRMFFADAPETGWRFLRPIATVDLWASDVTAAAITATAVTDSGRTVMTVTGASPLSESMEFKMVTVTDLTNQVMITKVLSTTTCEINLNGESDFSAKTFAITANGRYTLPPYFAGVTTGPPTYVADSDVGVGLSWANETEIRRWRESSDDSTGNPIWLAVRPMYTDGLGNRLMSRRWELLAYPTPSEDEVIEFPFEFHFDKMVDHLESPPVPFSHDECLKAACLAVIERDVYDRPGRHWANYHEKALPKSVVIDRRSAPRRLGYFGNHEGGTYRDISYWRGNIYDRPDVTGTGFN